MRKLLIVLTLISSITCIAQDTKWITWTKKYEGQKNYFPEYGNLQKTKDEIKADNDFIETITKFGYSKQESSNQMATKGWTALRQSDYENAMLRFNQSWLLDSTNVNALWGFGTIMGILQNSDDAIKYLERAYKYNPTTSRLLVDISVSYLIRYNIKKDKNDLNDGLSSILNYLKIDPKNEEALYKTAIFYFHLEDFSSSWSYLNQCYEQGGRLVQQEFVDALNVKMKNPKN